MQSRPNFHHNVISIEKDAALNNTENIPGTNLLLPVNSTKRKGYTVVSISFHKFLSTYPSNNTKETVVTPSRDTRNSAGDGRSYISIDENQATQVRRKILLPPRAESHEARFSCARRIFPSLAFIQPEVA